MGLLRPPAPALSPFVESVWVSDSADASAQAHREHVLPCGHMHLAVRLGGPPLRLFAHTEDHLGHTVGDAVVAGARAGFYIKQVQPARSIGALLCPGAAEALFGVSAAELAATHTRLDDMWGGDAESLREQLTAATSPAQQLHWLESMLLARLHRPRVLHPEVAQALAKLRRGDAVAETADASGYSHRRFIARFRDAVGLAPKRYARVQRFQRVLRAMTAPPASWCELALRVGYSDQAHFNREFREFSGVTPQTYRRAAPASPQHLPVAAPP